jgi:uncharacterized protein (DUF2141 family)
MRRRSSTSPVVVSLFESMESRTLLSVTPKWVEVPISSAAKAADGNLNNYKTYDLQVTVSSGDNFASGDLKAQLTSGQFYIPSSSNDDVAQKSLWTSKPNLQFDTFVTTPNFGSTFVLGRSTYPTAQVGSEIFSSTTTDVSWGDLSGNGSGTFTVARLTIKNGSTGMIRGRVGGTANPNSVVTFSVGVPPTTSGGASGSISGNVFRDSNGNRVKDSGESGISGVTVYLDSNNNSHLDSGETTVSTDSSGNYRFTGLSAGTYKIRQVVPTGFSQTTPTSNFGNNATLSGSSSSVSGKNFGDKPISTSASGIITGRVFHDFNRNGSRDSNDTGLSGWTVYIDLDNDSILDAGEKRVTTDSSGAYKFSNLSAGTYKIRVVRPSGWTQTTPSNNFGRNASLSTSSSRVDGLNFGFDN